MAKENKYLIELKELISVLSKSELSIARKFLKAFSTNLTVNTEKQLLIFDNVNRNKAIPYSKLKKKVSSISSAKSFDALLIRVNARVKESLIVDVNILRPLAYSELIKVRYKLKKEIVQARILYSKGLVNLSLKLYDNIIKTAEKFELFDEVIEALLFKLNFNSSKKKEGKYYEIREKVIMYKKEREYLDDIRFLVYEYTAKLGVKSEKQILVLSIEKNIRIIYKKQIEVKSCNALSVLLLMQIEYCSIIGNTKLLIDSNKKLLNLLVNNPSVYSTNRIIYINNEIAYSYVLSFDFDIARQHLNDALVLFKNNFTRNYINSISIEVTIAIFQHEYHRGDKMIEEIQLKPVLEKFPIDKSKKSFLKSVCRFGLYDFKESLRLLNELKEIEKDKEGWNVWIRIMRILCSIELLRLNLVDYDIESFRKYIQRLSKDGNINPRVDLILKILLELDRRNYNFKEVAQKRKVELTNLKKTTGKYKWDIKSPEMILFHDWFMAKMENRPYEANLDPYRKQVERDESKPLSKTKEKKYRSLGLIA